MTMSRRPLAVVACVALILATGQAHGFFPKGGFNFSMQLRYATWPFYEFDNNENGVIERDEGLEFRIESGPRGFTPSEIEQVKAGFKVWQDVPTSYASFRFVGSIEDPIVPGELNGDYLPMVFMQVESVPEDDGYTQLDPTETLVAGLSWFQPAVTLTYYTIETTVLTVGGNAVIVPAGTILDCDIVVNATPHRATGATGTGAVATLDLQATVAHQVGHLLGLSYTPLNNLDPVSQVILADDEVAFPVETAVLQITGPDGVRRMRGATPTMFPLYFLTEMLDGSFVAGWRDLAPDDIAGVSWLYPREDGLENFFNIKHEARTHARRSTGIPPSPIAGGHVVAWANISTVEKERRVPLFSTMSGLYEWHNNTQLGGMFNLMGLMKQMEVPGRDGELYEPSYVITLNPIDGVGGFDRQAPPEFTSADFDSMQGSFPLSYTLFPRADAFSGGFPSSVFNEHGNIYGIDNNTVGTPLVWSFEKNTVISKDTGKTLPAILPRRKPMFGDEDRVCPMNIIENPGGGTTPDGTAPVVTTPGTGTGTTTGGTTTGGTTTGGTTTGGSEVTVPVTGGDDDDDKLLVGSVGDVFTNLNGRLRRFRDGVLLRSAVGTACVDLYYRAAPWMAAQLSNHELVLRAVRRVILAFSLSGEYIPMMVFAFIGGCIAFVRVSMKRRAMVTTAALLLLVLLTGASFAFAGQLPVSDAELTAESTFIVYGEVASAQGRLAANGRIYTDVVFEVIEDIKGGLNRGSQVSFSIIGGRYETIALAATGLPGFSDGERIIVYLRDIPGHGLVPYGGHRSKVPVYLESGTDEEYVVVEGSMDEDAADSEEGEGVDDSVDDGDEPVSSEKSLRRARGINAGPVPVREYIRYLRALARSVG